MIKINQKVTNSNVNGELNQYSHINENVQEINQAIDNAQTKSIKQVIDFIGKVQLSTNETYNLKNDEIVELKILISHNKIEKALDILINRINDCELLNSFILLKARWTENYQRYLLGTISVDENNLFNSQITNSLLNFMDRINENA